MTEARASSRLVTAIVALIVILGCGGGGAGVPDDGSGGTGTVKLTLSSAVSTTNASRTVALTAKVEGNTEKRVTFACNSGEIIADDGLGKAIWKAGPAAKSALIRATAVANKAVTASVTIAVTDPNLHLPLTTDVSLADVGDEVVFYSDHTFTGARRVLVGEPTKTNPTGGFVEAAIVETSATNTRFLVPAGTPMALDIPIRLLDGDVEIGFLALHVGPTGVYNESEYNDVDMFSDNPLEIMRIRGDSDSHFHSEEGPEDPDVFTFRRAYARLTGDSLDLKPIRYEVSVSGTGDATIDGIPLDGQRKGIFTCPPLIYRSNKGYSAYWRLQVRRTAGPYEVRLRRLID